MLQEQNRSCVSALRPSKRMKEIDQLDHFCARKTLTLKKKGKAVCMTPLVKVSFISMGIKNHFHIKDLAHLASF